MRYSDGHVRGGRVRAGAKALPLALAVALGVAAGTVAVGFAQQAPADRLPSALLDVTPPSGRVSGAPGRMTIRRTPCRNTPLADVRRRIVDIAVQEWAFFGFSVVDRTNIAAADRAGQRSRRRWRRLTRTESARVADSIAGYWAVTPQGGWILDAQNRVWNGPRGIAARWRYPWSAAFVSWVMCEGGLGDASRFQRAVAHHVYIDQAIRARRTDETPAGYAAYDIGETPIAPGDLLCSARRPRYRSIAERRRQMGNGARTHCDVVVKLDRARDRILAIGGNVRGTVALKLLPAAGGPGQDLHPVGGTRPLFAHLKLRVAPIAADAFDHTPTMRLLRCAEGFQARARLTGSHLLPDRRQATRC
ncbi:MAG: DUF2272 domain-containing protein [Acidobacteria bacterium]|nr:DUF2272 domain-containing protein [Acidobacteriota bacterium]